MFEDSDLLQRNTLVLRATSPPDAQFSVLDETGREIGRVVGEGRLSRNEPAQLVLYDRQQTSVLAVERREENDDGTRVVRPYKYIDGYGQPRWLLPADGAAHRQRDATATSPSRSRR